MLKKIIFYLFLVIGLVSPALSFAYGDDDEQVAEDTRKMVLIDGKHIQNKTDNPNANFRPLVDRINHELVSCGLYRVLNEEDWETALKTAEKTAVAADDGGNQTEIKSPGYVLKLTVATYGVFTSKETNAVYLNTQRSEVAHVEFILRIVDLKTGLTRRSKNISRQAECSAAANVGQQKRGNYQEVALQEACAYAAQDIIRELVELDPFYVIGIEGDQIILDVPASVAKREVFFEIRKAGASFVNRRTGKKTISRKSFCIVQVTNVSEDSCNAVIVGYYPEFQGKSIARDGKGFSVHCLTDEQKAHYRNGGSSSSSSSSSSQNTGTAANPF